MDSFIHISALCAIYHPQASTQSEESVSIGSCGADGAVMLWNRKVLIKISS